MLYSLKALTGFAVRTPDGASARLHDVHLDARQWTVRHFVVERDGADGAARVLVPPQALHAIDGEAFRLDLDGAQAQLDQAPDARSDPPVGRQLAAAARDDAAPFGDSATWGLLDLPLGGAIAPFMLPDEADVAAGREAGREPPEALPGDPHLHAGSDLAGYTVSASDGPIGHLDDLWLDDRLQRVELVVVDTHDWLPDRLVLVPTRWIERLDAALSQAVFSVPRAAIEASPPWQRDAVPAREAAVSVQQHFEGWQ